MTAFTIITLTLACLCLPSAVFLLLQVWRELRALRTGHDVFQQLRDKRRRRTEQVTRL
ncbi:MAG: hypothetical protein V4671_15880 [Armatimonadota bacterium]